jgi:hypothetical protein
MDVRCPGCGRRLRGVSLKADALANLNCPGCDGSLASAAIIAQSAYRLAPGISMTASVAVEVVEPVPPAIALDPAPPPEALSPVPDSPQPSSFSESLQEEPAAVQMAGPVDPIERITEEPPPSVVEETSLPSDEAMPSVGAEAPGVPAAGDDAATVVMDRPDFAEAAPLAEAVTETSGSGGTSTEPGAVLSEPDVPASDVFEPGPEPVPIEEGASAEPPPPAATSEEDHLLRGALVGGLLGLLSAICYLLVFSGVDWTRGDLFRNLLTLDASSLGTMGALVGVGLLGGLLISRLTHPEEESAPGESPSTSGSDSP